MTRFLQSIGAALALAAGLAAQDDREQTAPVPTLFRTGQSVADLNALRVRNRFTDLEIESTSPLRFTVAGVWNDSFYGYDKTWWYYTDVTTTTLSQALAANRARLIDLETWDDNGTTKHAAIAIANVGTDATAWWWYVDITSLQVNSFVNSNSARLVNLERYSKGGTTRYSCVMVDNSGGNARNTRHFYSATLATIDAWNAANNTRIYDIERVSQDRFDAIVVGSQGQAWWHYYGRSQSQVELLLEQKAARIIDIERRPLFGGLVTYDVVMIDNARTELEKQTRAILDRTDGVTGALIKRTNGVRLADINERYVFEPAHTLKTVLHAQAMHRVERQLIFLSSLLTVSTGNATGCPTGGGTTFQEPLRSVLGRLMTTDDNATALAVENALGIGMSDAIARLGLTSTARNHRIGCGGPVPNTMSLVDLVRTFEKTGDGDFFTAAGTRDTFLGLMRNDLDFPHWGTVDLSHRIRTYGAALGLSSAAIRMFEDEITVASMSGSYTIQGSVYTSEGGFIEVPYRNFLSGQVQPVGYAFGAFDHGASNERVSRDTVSDAVHEMVWDVVRPALDEWTRTRTLTVQSTNPARGVTVRVSPFDVNGRSGGSTPATFAYFDRSTVTLSVDPTQGCNTFRRWVIDGVPRLIGQRQVSFSMQGNSVAVAEYRDVKAGTTRVLGAGCRGGTGVVPMQSIEHANGACGPQQGTVTSYVLQGGAPNAIGVMHLGFSTEFFGKIELPWDLSSLGATGCVLYHDLVVSPQIQLDPQGHTRLNLTWPIDPAARGLEFHSTFATIDPAANALGLVHSNAMSVSQGGTQ